MKEIITAFNRPGVNDPFYLSMCGLSFCDGTYKIQRPNSRITCFQYVIRGGGTITTNGKTFRAGKGDVFMLYEGDDHYYYSDAHDPWTNIWFNIEGDLQRDIITRYGLGSVNLIEAFDIYRMFAEFVVAARNPLKNSIEIFNETAIIFLRIVQAIAARIHTEHEQIPEEASIIREYIHRHLEERVTVDDLARLVNFSPTHVNRIFKNAFNTTPYNYTLNAKLARASLLLANSSIAIKDIAARLNFANEFYFSSLFKSKNGVSPRAYREGAKRR